LLFFTENYVTLTSGLEKRATVLPDNDKTSYDPTSQVGSYEVLSQLRKKNLQTGSGLHGSSQTAGFN
jgi:hypothetical protein